MKIFNSNDKNLNELIRGGTSAFLLKITGMLFTYLSMLFITRIFGAEAWGLYTLGFTVLSIAIVVPVFGFDNSLIRLITDLKENNNSQDIIFVLLRASLITVVLSVVVVFLIVQYSDFIVQDILRKENFKPYLILVQIAILPMALLVLISAVFQSYKNIIKFMLFKSALLSTIFFICLCTSYFLKLDLEIFEIYIYTILIVLLIASVALGLFLSKRINKSNTTIRKQGVGIKKIVTLSFPMMMSSSFALLMGWTDILMLSYFKTSTDIGIYNTALKLATITLIALASINSISSPKFAELFSKKDIDGLKDVVQKSTKLMFLTSAPVLLVFMVMPKTILNIFGPEFVSGYTVLIVLCAARFINAISGSVGYLMQMTNNQNTYQLVIIIAFVINLILNYLLIPKFGINGAAISSSIAMVFWNITLVVIIKNRLGFWTIYLPFLKK